MSSPETSHLVTRTQPLSSDSLLCYRLRGRKSRKLRARERIKKTFCLFCFAEGWEKVSTLELVHYLVSGIASRFSQSVSAWLSASGSAHHHHLLRGALWFLSFSLAMVWVPLLFSLLYIYFWLLKLNIHTEPIDCCLVKEKGVKLFVCFFLWLLGGGWEKITKRAVFAFDSEAGIFFFLQTRWISNCCFFDGGGGGGACWFFVGYFLLLAIFYDMGNYPNLRSKQFKLYLVAFYSIRSLSYSSTTIRQHSWDTFQRGGEICWTTRAEYTTVW